MDPRRSLRSFIRASAEVKVRFLTALHGLRGRPRLEAPDPIGSGPGGPVLVAVTGSDPFGRYLAEILLAEGVNAFAVEDIASVSERSLTAYDVVLLGTMSLSSAHARTLCDWVHEGGSLVAMRPDRQLTDLLGLGDRFSTLSDAYLVVDATQPPGLGVTPEPMQFHGEADLYRVTSARIVATLCQAPGTKTSSPAVTLRRVGARGGYAAAFTYDLARSVVYTRQGNPALAERPATGRMPRRTSDWFRAARPDGSDGDWIDLTRIRIPQADEQQRLLVNLIEHVNRDRRPLPRFWYFPRGSRAVVVMTGDDHGRGGTAGRFDAYKAASPPGGSVADWDGVRSTSYVSVHAPLSDREAAAYGDEGFEIALHVATRPRARVGRGRNWTPASLQMFYARQLRGWRHRYPSLPPPVSVRTHSVVWSDWATQPRVEFANGIRFDTNYYHWPDSWLGGHPGFLTGSGIPMRFADLDGTLIDVFQGATQMTDESGQVYPETVETLLELALGPEGYSAALGANVHTDDATSSVSDAIVGAAQARGVPIVSARQMLEWLDARNASSFAHLTWDGGTLSFTIEAPREARGLHAMVPCVAQVGRLIAVMHDDGPVEHSTATIKGIEYAFFPAVPGAYRVTYGRESAVPAPELEGHEVET